MMHNSEEDIHRLVDKFMAGDTTLAEERLLYTYFAGGSVADDLKPLRPMMLGLQSLGSLSCPNTSRPQATSSQAHPITSRPRPTSSRHRRMRVRHWLVAAALLAGLMVTATVYVGHRENYCEAYVYGQRVTDRDAIRAEMAHTMQAVGITGDNGVDDQLHDVLMTDN